MKRELLVALGLSVGLCAAWGCGEPEEDPVEDVGVEDVGGDDDAGDVGGEDGGEDADVEEDGGDGGGSDGGVDVSGTPEGRTYFRSVSGVVVSCEESCEVACELSLDGGEAEAVACEDGVAFDLEGLEYGTYQLDAVVDGEVAASRSFEVHPPEWSAVSGGEGHTCAILLDGHLVCFGRGDEGQLGDGAMTSSAEARHVNGMWSAVDAGARHTCAISDAGELYCWGTSVEGALGIGETSADSPAQVGAESDWESVSAGGTHSCGIRAGGALYCWGDSSEGATGLGGDVSEAAEPVLVEADGVGAWSAVSAGTGFTCALTDAGVLYCWGRADAGVVGTNGEDVLEPRVYEGELSFVALSAGDVHTCGVLDLGDSPDDVYCWGEGGSYQLGTAETRRENAPKPRSVGSVELMSVTSGDVHSCGLAADGTMHCWGQNLRGQLGFDPVTTEFPFPAQAGEEVWASVSAGELHTCGVRASDKGLLCWGDNSDGELGRGEVGEEPLFEAAEIIWPF
ncbi:hypothetical protein EA187_07275 [Lujinxingia sediminis]|uniref:Chromosome condensation regulator RCC1 n=1 Tax=Lujinxingia sediminis TaxID=2480984 RepID=A0ABY0CVU7_9DELT|nr:RCC1 domain-containing protein [Lujinxingia sediminis]RVU46928.1 hypothetical protein EA187_07275 [Lujinxingia sediminis]